MRKLLFLLMFISSTAAMAWGNEWEAYPTLPGTGVRDYSKGGQIYKPDTYGKGGTVYPTLPGSSVRDYSKPGVRVTPGYGNPSYRIERKW